LRFGASQVGQNGSMNVPGEPARDRPRVVPALAGVLVAGAAWVLLIVVAIGFGRRGQEGETAAWFLLALTGLGAAVCLVLALFFGRQLLVAAGVLTDYQPKRARR
jgi:hypothetical protein